MTPKNDKNNDEDLTSCFKTDITNLAIFDSSTQKSQRLVL